MSDLMQGLHWIGRKLTALWNEVKTEAPAISGAVTHFFDTWEADAVAAVEAEWPKAISGEEKMSNVLKDLAIKIVAAGWKDFEATLQTLAQDAYQAVANRKGEAVPIPPTRHVTGLLTSALKALSGLLGIGKMIAAWQAKREAKHVQKVEDENTDLRASTDAQRQMDAEPAPNGDDVAKRLRDGSF